MTLTEYLSSERGRAKALAARLNRSPGWLSGLVSGRLNINPLYMALIEEETGGAVPFDAWRPSAEEIAEYRAQVCPKNPQKIEVEL